MDLKQEDLPPERIAVLRIAFDEFDNMNTGYISTEIVETILEKLGHSLDDKLILKKIIEKVDSNGSGKLKFEEFVTLVSRFVDEEDVEVMQQELKEAFRLFDREGSGYIPTEALREILKALVEEISDEELENIIKEIGYDDFGNVHFDDYMKVWRST